MVRHEKGDRIALMKSAGYPIRHIAWVVYGDRSEKGQRKVRAMLSYMKKKAPLNDAESGSTQQAEHSSWRDIFSELRKRKNLGVATLFSRGFSVRAIAILLYGNDNQYNINRVWAHISKLRKNLRSRVGVVNFTNKTCDFGLQLQPQPKPELERMISSCDGGEAIPTI